MCMWEESWGMYNNTQRNVEELNFKGYLLLL